METIDVRGLPKEKVDYLQQLVRQWKWEQKPAPTQEEDDVKPSDSTVVKSHIIGGKLTRAMAYEDDV